MGKFFKEKWLDWIITSIIPSMLVLIIYGMGNSREDKQELKKEIEKRTPYEYVKEQDAILQKQIDRSKEEITNRLDRMESKMDNSNDKILDLWKNMKSGK